MYKIINIPEKDIIEELNKQEKQGWEAIQYLEKNKEDINGNYWKIIFWKK